MLTAQGAFSNNAWIGLAACKVVSFEYVSPSAMATYVDERLEIFVEVRQIILAPLVVGNQLVLAFL